jgi:hypothetical protein
VLHLLSLLLVVSVYFVWLSRFWRDNWLPTKEFAANFADFRGLAKKNSREFAQSVAKVLLFPLITVEPFVFYQHHHPSPFHAHRIRPFLSQYSH